MVANPGDKAPSHPPIHPVWGFFCATGDIGLEINTINGPDLLRCVDSRTGGEEVDGCEGVRGTVRVPKFIEFVNMDVEDNEYTTLVTWPWDDVKVRGLLCVVVDRAC